MFFIDKLFSIIGAPKYKVYVNQFKILYVMVLERIDTISIGKHHLTKALEQTMYIFIDQMCSNNHY